MVRIAFSCGLYLQWNLAITVTHICTKHLLVLGMHVFLIYLIIICILYASKNVFCSTFFLYPDFMFY